MAEWGQTESQLDELACMKWKCTKHAMGAACSHMLFSHGETFGLMPIGPAADSQAGHPLSGLNPAEQQSVLY